MSQNFGYLTPGVDNLNGTYMPFFDPYAANYENPQTGTLVGSAPDPSNPNPTIPYPTQGGTSNVSPTTGNVGGPATATAAPAVLAPSTQAPTIPTRTAAPDESAGLTTPTAGPGSGALPTGILPAGQTVGGAPPMAGAGAVGSATPPAAGTPASPIPASTSPNLLQILQSYLTNPSDPSTLAALHTAVTASMPHPEDIPPPPGSSPAIVHAYYARVNAAAQAKTGYAAPPTPQTTPEGTLLPPGTPPVERDASPAPAAGGAENPQVPAVVQAGGDTKPGVTYGNPGLGTSGGAMSGPGPKAGSITGNPGLGTSGGALSRPPIVTQPTPGAQTTPPAFTPRPAYPAPTPAAPLVTQPTTPAQ